VITSQIWTRPPDHLPDLTSHKTNQITYVTGIV
jgi:hypothetical protein